MKPILIKNGAVTVKIYATPGPKYPAYTICYCTKTGRKRLTRSDLRIARNEAEIIAAQLANGLCPVELTPADQKEFLDAREICGGNVMRAAKIAALLDRECPDVEAEDLIAHWHRTRAKINAKAPREILGEMLLSKRQDKLSEKWLYFLENTLTKFADLFTGPLADVTGPQIDDWLRSGKLAPRSRKGYLGAVAALASFAKSKGYLPEDWDECAKVSIGRIDTGRVHILTPAQLRTLLAGVNAKLRVYCAIAAWAGVRSAEISRLSWSDVGSDYIVIDAHKAKTAQRRLVPILPPLRSVLAVADRSQPISGYVAPENKITRQAQAVGVEWHQNVLRHSFCSYRLAQTQSAAQVAMEAGNSPTVIIRHYRELVTPAQASEWFSV